MEQNETLKRTPLYPHHLRLDARMMPFAGYSMPVHYRGIVEEHMAVRNAAGLFDVSHMGEVLLSGNDTLLYLQRLVTNDLSALYPGRAMYTVMCHEDGGIIDDLLVYRLQGDRYMLVINAANRDKDLAWMRAQATEHDVDVEDVSDQTALLALQGPATAAILAALSPDPPVDDLKYYHFREGARVGGIPVTILSRTGYTGEYGLELYCSVDAAPELWDALIERGAEQGLLPAGLGARDTLRLEAGMPLYGNELDETINPFEAGLSWIVKMDKGDFIGRRALEHASTAGPDRRLVGFMLDERGIPRHGYDLVTGTEVVGHVTSGTQSPVLGKGIGMGYVKNDPSILDEGAPLGVRVRGRVLSAHISRPPFHKK